MKIPVIVSILKAQDYEKPRSICNILFPLELSNNVQLLRVTTSSYNFELSFFEMCWRLLVYEIRQYGALLVWRYKRMPYVIGILQLSEKKSIKLICMNMYNIIIILKYLVVCSSKCLIFPYNVCLVNIFILLHWYITKRKIH